MVLKIYIIIFVCLVATPEFKQPNLLQYIVFNKAKGTP